MCNRLLRSSELYSCVLRLVSKQVDFGRTQAPGLSTEYIRLRIVAYTETLGECKADALRCSPLQLSQKTIPLQGNFGLSTQWRNLYSFR
jgi:hypothetical protein